MARPERIRLGEILVQQQLLTAAQLQEALEEQRATGRRLGRVFIERGFVSEEQISTAIARQLNVPFIDLRRHTLRPELAKLLPESQARRFRALVLEDRQSSYVVAMADPTDLFAYDEIARLLGRELNPAVATETLLLLTIDRAYRRTGQISGLAQELGRELGDGNDRLTFAAGPTDEDVPVARLLQGVFEEAVAERASDIHLEPQANSLAIRYRVDGVLHLQTEAEARVAPALVLRLKLMAGLDISEKRLPQDGRFNVEVRGTPVDLRISTMPTQFGESVVMRLLVQSGGRLGLDRIGLPAQMLRGLRAAIGQPSGMVLVTGPTGSGKTTTLYSALDELNSPQRKIITVEDPVEYRLPGLNQVQVQEKIDLTFARVLRASLRQDPDVILVGEMRDQETVEVGLRAAITGHLVLSTLHTTDAASTPMRLMDMGAPRYMVAMSLTLVLAQRLVRLTCENCATPARPTPAQLAWLRGVLGGEPDAGALHVGRGCAQCNQTGFHGRSGVYEMLEMSRDVVDALHGADPSAFAEAARAQMRGQTLAYSAADLALAGRTTAEEAMKVSHWTAD